jgi:hypothetical protein
MLGEKTESKFGYPFQIYNDLGDERIKDDTLASILSELQTTDYSF